MGLTHFPHGILATPNLPGCGEQGPIFGNIYFVDATNGNDGNSGTDPKKAFKTIQKAITTQIAFTSGLGDVIYVFPGTYAESLTGNLTRVSIIGVPGYGSTAHTVSVRPTASYAYTGTMFEAAIRNIMVTSPSTSNTTYPAVYLTNARYSTIDNCLFLGRVAGCVEGLQIGNPVADYPVTANLDFCRITNNTFTTIYGASCQFTYGIKLGVVADANDAPYKQFWGSVIANNIINAATTGIYLGTNNDKNQGGMIRDNYITSLEAAGDEGCSTFCIGANASQGTFVVHNYCATAAAAAAINGFAADHVLDNYTSQNGVAKSETIIA